MKVLALLVIGCIVLGCCDAGVLSDQFKQAGDNFKDSMKQLGAKLSTVGSALKSVTVDRFKSLGSQALQALAGAILNSFKGFDFGKALFGRREIDGCRQEVMTLIGKLIKDAASTMDALFEHTFTRFGKVIGSLVDMKPAAEVETHIAQISAEHELAVRGVLGDTLNLAIDGLKSLWYKAKAILGGVKDSILGSKGPETADPVMIGRRGMLADAWTGFKSKLESLKEDALLQFEKASEVTRNIATSLGHYAGKMLKQAKSDAIGKMRDTLGELVAKLTDHLEDAKDTFSSVKQGLAETLEKLMQ